MFRPSATSVVLVACAWALVAASPAAATSPLAVALDNARPGDTVQVGGVTILAYRLRLIVLAVGSTVVTGYLWLELAAGSFERAVRNATLTELWWELEAWPLVVAAALAGAPALFRALPTPVRVGAAAVAGLVLAVRCWCRSGRIPPSSRSRSSCSCSRRARSPGSCRPRGRTPGRCRWGPVPPG